MPGDIRAKERAIVTLTSTGSSLTNGSAGSAGTDFDARAAGNAANDFYAQFELTCQWSTVTGITANLAIGELYLVPKMDGTNLPDIDTTSGASMLPATTFFDYFVATKAPTANTNARFVTQALPISPRLYTAYLKNTSGQTISANWTLKVISDQAQYT